MIATVIAAIATLVPLAPLAPPCPPPPVQASIVVPYRAPACTYCAGHRGVEFATSVGTPVAAVAGGVVTFAGSVAGTRYVVVQQDDGLRATYGKLSVVRAATGMRLAAGTVLGAASARLYFGWRRTIGGVEHPVDPTPVLGTWQARRRLLPPPGTSPRTRPGRAADLRLVCPAGASSRDGR